MNNFTEILSIIRPGQNYVIEAPGKYENLKWHPLNDTEKPTKAECLAVADQAEQLAATKRAAKQLRQLSRQRAAAYRSEADPLFFKSQRGEATTAEWEAKVAEIKARYPYPDEA